LVEELPIAAGFAIDDVVDEPVLVCMRIKESSVANARKYVQDP
jgi:hypothetical protein